MQRGNAQVSKGRAVRRWWWAAIAVVVAALAMSCAPRVEVPADAEPVEIVTGYLEAVLAGDCRTAKDLIHSGEAAWCGSGSATIASYEIGVVDDPPPCSPPCKEARQGWAESWLVHTTLEITRTDSGHSVSVGPDQPWIFIVARQSPSDPWRIIDQGHI